MRNAICIKVAFHEISKNVITFKDDISFGIYFTKINISLEPI